jgi:uncharacterized membrane protein YqjE
MREHTLKTDENGAGFLPLLLMNPLALLIIIIVIIALVISGVLFAVFATKTLLTLIFVGVGLYLLVKPGLLAGSGSMVRFGVPICLMIVGAAWYLDWLKF